MFYSIVRTRTRNDFGLMVLRLALGIVFLAHGSQKLLGWFGGPGYAGTMQNFTETMGIPAPFAILAIAAEFFGGLGLIFGFLGRIAALGIISNMAVAIAMVHLPFGLFMNWQGNQAGEGFEYHLLAIAMGLAVLINGSGAVSIDRAITSHRVHEGVESHAERRAA
jgi:putative oxidoreductase